MSVILFPQRFLVQPQYLALIKDPGFWRLVDIQSLPPLGTAAASITRTLNGTTKLNTGRAGRCVDFAATGDWLSYGTNTALQLSTMTGLAVVEVPSSPSDYATILNTKVDAAFSGGFVIRVNPDGTVLALKQDTVAIGSATTKTVRLDGISTVAWSYNNVSGLLRIAIDGVLESFTSAQTFNHGIVGRNQYYHSSTTQAKAHKQYLFALSAECDRVTNAELIAWSNDPWSVFKAPSRLIPVPVGGGEVTGTVAYTNVDDTSAATASPAITGSSTTTNADDISAANAVGAVTGSSATTNLDDASAASAVPVATASSATTNADDVSNASAAVGSEVTATVAITNVDDTSSATASPVASASSSTTNAADVSSASAAPIVTANAANTNADDISVASAASGSEARGSVAYTNIDDVSASVLTATITASVVFTNSNDTSSAAGGGYTIATVAYINADDTSLAFASPVVSGSLATANADDVSEATAIAEAVEVVASVAVTNANDLSAAVAAPVIVGSVAYSNLHDLSAAIGVVNFGTIVETKLTTGIVEAARVKKPGIPSTAPQWQRTMFEIMTGRRGNKIAIPPQQALTFSATPTKEECEALHSYLNDVRGSMEQLINRFDS